MVEQEQRTAQKGFILDQTQKHLLVIKYRDSQFVPGLNGKYGLPGGQIEFGGDPDQEFTREVEEETGITVTPGIPFYIYTWTYSKGEKEKQIIAVARLAYYESGQPYEGPKDESESKIELVTWLELDNLDPVTFVEDERPIIEAYFRYRGENPFSQ